MTSVKNLPLKLIIPILATLNKIKIKQTISFGHCTIMNYSQDHGYSLMLNLGFYFYCSVYDRTNCRLKTALKSLGSKQSKVC